MKCDTLAGQKRILAAENYRLFRARLSGSDCRLCPLHAGRAHLVVDRGNAAAQLMVVGEAPGAEEDRLGMAFVGRSGKLLDEMLREAGLDPGRDILIANVVKCRPPENRVPAPAEVDACILYLRRQIELVQPRLLLLLGATAVRHLLPSRKRERMAAVAGRLFESQKLPGRQLLVTYHPAFVLRNPAKRREMVGHLKKAKKHLPGRGSLPVLP